MKSSPSIYLLQRHEWLPGFGGLEFGFNFWLFSRNSRAWWGPRNKTKLIHKTSGVRIVYHFLIFWTAPVQLWPRCQKGLYVSLRHHQKPLDCTRLAGGSIHALVYVLCGFSWCGRKQNANRSTLLRFLDLFRLKICHGRMEIIYHHGVKMLFSWMSK